MSCFTNHPYVKKRSDPYKSLLFCFSYFLSSYINTSALCNTSENAFAPEGGIKKCDLRYFNPARWSFLWNFIRKWQKKNIWGQLYPAIKKMRGSTRNNETIYPHGQRNREDKNIGGVTSIYNLPKGVGTPYLSALPDTFFKETSTANIYIPAPMSSSARTKWPVPQL